MAMVSRENCTGLPRLSASVVPATVVPATFPPGRVNVTPSLAGPTAGQIDPGGHSSRGSVTRANRTPDVDWNAALIRICSAIAAGVH